MIIADNKFLKMKWLFVGVSSMILGFALSVPRAKATQTTTTTETIDFNKKPTSGQDAFWAHNPKAPYQKILLVPSQHYLSLRFIRADLAKVMKEAEILVTESSTKAETWDEAKAFKRSLHFKVDSLKQSGVIRDHPFEYEGRPWTARIPERDLAGIRKVFADNLAKIPLENIHPVIVLNTLTRVFANKAKNIGGMDNQIVREFNKQRKVILVLETDEDLGIAEKSDTAWISEKPIDKELLFRIKRVSQKIHSLSEETPRSQFEKEMKQVKTMVEKYNLEPMFALEVQYSASIRNSLWLPKLIKYFKKDPHKFFVVVVGAGHFPGDSTGILKLLSEKGFTFTPFEGTQPTAAYVGAQQKPTGPLPEKEQKKAEIKVTQEEATSSVDSALNDRSAGPTKLPQVVVLGKVPEDASSIRSELINAMVRIGKTALPFTRLNSYITVRNAIYTDSTIVDKVKALEVLQRNPHFTFDQVKKALH